jgi:hypothetical protein
MHDYGFFFHFGYKSFIAYKLISYSFIVFRILKTFFLNTSHINNVASVNQLIIQYMSDKVRSPGVLLGYSESLWRDKRNGDIWKMTQ